MKVGGQARQSGTGSAIEVLPDCLIPSQKPRGCHLHNIMMPVSLGPRTASLGPLKVKAESGHPFEPCNDSCDAAHGSIARSEAQVRPQA